MATPAGNGRSCIVCGDPVLKHQARIEDRRGFAAHLQCLQDMRLLAEQYQRPLLAKMRAPTPEEGNAGHPPLRHAAC